MARFLELPICIHVEGSGREEVEEEADERVSVESGWSAVEGEMKGDEERSGGEGEPEGRE